MHTIPMTRSTLGHCAWLTTETYGPSDPFKNYIRPNPTAFPAHWARVFADRLKTFFISADHALRVMVSDDSDTFHDATHGAEGAVMGYAVWTRYRGSVTDAPINGKQTLVWSQKPLLAGFETALLNLQMKYVTWLKPDTAYDYAALATFIGTLRKLQAKLNEVVRSQSPERGYIYLEELHCKPEFQRKGVGARLLQQGLEQGVAENVPVCLLASEEGEKLYSKKGFETVGMAYFGVYKVPAMVWWPEERKPRVKQAEYFVVDGNKVEEESA